MTPNARSNSVAQRDIEFHIHSQTNPEACSRSKAPYRRVAGARESASSIAAGKPYIDAMAGLWCASLGFNNKRLAAAATRQYAESRLLSHVLFAHP